MRSFHNIDKSGFNRGEYVGYTNGRKFRITKTSSLSVWQAVEAEPGKPARFALAGGARLHARTLEGISKLLEDLDPQSNRAKRNRQLAIDAAQQLGMA